jgi:hypothetical protein
MFGFSIGASTIGLGELTESNRPVCDDALSGLGGSGFVVVRCLQNMTLSIMHSSLLYAIILLRKYSIRSGTNNYFYRSCQFRFEYINVLYNVRKKHIVHLILFDFQVTLGIEPLCSVL